jgi:hypothetical protein
LVAEGLYDWLEAGTYSTIVPFSLAKTQATNFANFPLPPESRFFFISAMAAMAG